MLDILRFIKGAQALGFTLAELSTALNASADGVPERRDMIDGLKRKQVEISTHIKAATAKRRQIAMLIAELSRCDEAKGNAEA